MATGFRPFECATSELHPRGSRPKASYGPLGTQDTENVPQQRGFTGFLEVDGRTARVSPEHDPPNFGNAKTQISVVEFDDIVLPDFSWKERHVQIRANRPPNSSAGPVSAPSLTL